MKENKKDLLLLVKQWIEIAEEDLKFAKHGLKISSSIPYRMIAFHSQQCAEKYLKAYLVYHNVEFPYTHNITTLLDLCSDIDKNFENLRDAELLTSYATAFRYPSEFRKLRKSDAVLSLNLANKVREKIKKKFKLYGFK